MPENKDLLLEEGSQQPFTPPNGKTHLLVIAIDEYAHCPRLNNCVKDAKEFIEILDTRYGIAIDAALPPLFNGDATKKNIIYSFRKLAATRLCQTGKPTPGERRRTNIPKEAISATWTSIPTAPTPQRSGNTRRGAGLRAGATNVPAAIPWTRWRGTPLTPVVKRVR